MALTKKTGVKVFESPTRLLKSLNGYRTSTESILFISPES
jgi:hypothetical protein